MPAHHLSVAYAGVATLPHRGLEAEVPALGFSSCLLHPSFHSLIWPLMDLTQLLLQVRDFQPQFLQRRE